MSQCKHSLFCGYCAKDKDMIKTLLMKYKLELERNPLDQDIPNFNKTFNGARRLFLLDIIQDLEDLLK